MLPCLASLLSISLSFLFPFFSCVHLGGGVCGHNVCMYGVWNMCVVVVLCGILVVCGVCVCMLHL